MTTTPKVIFIIPYRNRELQRRFFIRHMKYILEDLNPSDFRLLFVHQVDSRDFNRGALKNIGFLITKQLYPNDYVNMTLVFNDVDTLPLEKNLFHYETTHGTVKHFFGFRFALGGIVSITGSDFERTGGFPNFWGWGYEDNALQKRVLLSKMKIDRTEFYPLLDKHVIQLQDGKHRVINRTDYNAYVADIQEGHHSISNLNYTLDDETHIANVTGFSTGREPNTQTRQVADMSITKQLFKKNGRGGSMKMVF
uniref:Galactosyltransferase C-terminal domain-containing protein n=1 Tax=viral metagenome TaxID=1070528 RepID=A0A6C0HJN8_9ZZZZ